MDIRAIRPQDLTIEDLVAWIGFQAAAPELDSPYLSPQWARAVERAMDASGPQIRVVVAHDGARPRGFLTVQIEDRVARPAGAPFCGYQGMVGDLGRTVDPKRLIEALKVDRFDFTHMLRSQSAFAPHMKGSRPSFVAHMPRGYAAYADEQGPGLITDLDEMRREIEFESGPFVFRAFSRSTADFGQLIAWAREARGDAQPSWAMRLARELFQSRDPEFGGVLFTLHVADQLAAAQFHLRGRRTLQQVISAQDPSFQPFSPSLFLSHDILRWMDETPYDVLDFGVGCDRAHRPFTNAVRSVGQGVIGHAGAGAMIRLAAERLVAVAQPARATHNLAMIRGLR